MNERPRRRLLQRTSHGHQLARNDGAVGPPETASDPFCTSIRRISAAMTDYLTNLPLELLEDILRRAFLPFARNARFRVLNISGSGKLEALWDLVGTSPGVAPYVKELDLASLARLTSLSHLRIAGSTRLAKAVLSDAKTPRLFPSLIRLALKDPFSGWANPFDPSHFLPLQRHKELRVLDLDVDRTPESLGRYKSPERIPILKSVWAFTAVLRGPLTTNEAAEDLLLSLPEVCSLWLEDRSLPSEGIVPLLETLPVPDRLVTLSIDCSLHPSTFQRLASSLPSFIALDCLRFMDDSFRPILLPTLRALPNLERLHFFSHERPSGADFKALIAGPTQLLRLSGLTFSHLEWAEDHDGVHQPVWRETFTKSDMEEVLDAADARQIEVNSSAAEWVRKERRKKLEAAARQEEDQLEEGAGALAGLAGLTLQSFLDAAAAEDVTITFSWGDGKEDGEKEQGGRKEVRAKAKKFGTGSFGWGATGKLTLPLEMEGEDGTRMLPVNFSCNLTVVNSKKTGDSTTTSKGSKAKEAAAAAEGGEEDYSSEDEEQPKKKRAKTDAGSSGKKGKKVMMRGQDP
ncbi:hypothetical protein JCM10213v2_005165 [Rhodosporidiobolus nylandii]